MANWYLSPVATIFQFFTNAGVVLNGGKITTYLAGSATPTQTATDSTGAVLNGPVITLDASGRLPNVQIWQQQGVPIKILVQDSGGNQLGPAFDNVYGIGDPTAVLAQLASVNPGQGAQLVANAVVSYQIFSNLRAAGVPSLVSGQSLMVQVQGGDAIGDSKAGTFYWSASSSAADDDNNTIAPTGAGTFGRYLRLPTANLPTLVNSLGALTMVAGGLIYGTSPTALTTLVPGTDGAALVLSGGLPVWQSSGGGSGAGTIQVQYLTGDVACGNTQTPVFSALPVVSNGVYAMYAELDGVVSGAPTLTTIMTSDQSGTITTKGGAIGFVVQEASGAFSQIWKNAAFPGITGQTLYNAATNHLLLRGRFSVDNSTTSVTFNLWGGGGSSPVITVKAGSYIQLLRVA